MSHSSYASTTAKLRVYIYDICPCICHVYFLCYCYIYVSSVVHHTSWVRQQAHTRLGSAVLFALSVTTSSGWQPEICQILIYTRQYICHRTQYIKIQSWCMLPTVGQCHSSSPQFACAVTIITTSINTLQPHGSATTCVCVQVMLAGCARLLLATNLFGL